MEGTWRIKERNGGYCGQAFFPKAAKAYFRKQAEDAARTKDMPRVYGAFHKLFNVTL